MDPGRRLLGAQGPGGDSYPQGYGWMLKRLSEQEPERLMKNHAATPRTAFRYALEKFGRQTRSERMAL